MSGAERVSDGYRDLPGFDLVAQGVDELAAGVLSIPALLVAQAPTRLSELGVDVPQVPFDDAPDRLYVAVELIVGEDAAHSHYNALRRRLVSFMSAAAVAQRAGKDYR